VRVMGVVWVAGGWGGGVSVFCGCVLGCVCCGCVWLVGVCFGCELGCVGGGRRLWAGGGAEGGGVGLVGAMFCWWGLLVRGVLVVLWWGADSSKGALPA